MTGSCRSSQVVDILSRCRGLFPWSSLQKTIEFLLFLNTMIRCPCCAGRAGSLVSGSHLFDSSPVEYRIMDFSWSSQDVPYSTLLGSTVDTCSTSVYEVFGRWASDRFHEGGWMI